MGRQPRRRTTQPQALRVRRQKGYDDFVSLGCLVLAVGLHVHVDVIRTVFEHLQLPALPLPIWLSS